MEKLKKILTYAVLRKVLCLLGCVYQCFDISMIFFSYKTSTNVKYESQKFVDIPGVSICYYKLEQINDKLKTELDQKVKAIDGRKTEYFNNMTIREQFNELDTEPVKLRDCFLRWNIGTDVKCNLIQNYTESFDGFLYCITAFSQDGDHQGGEKYHVKNSENNNKLMISFETRKTSKGVSYADEILVKLHDRKQRLRQSYTKGTLLINQEVPDFAYVKYQKTIVKYLFNPRFKPCFVGQKAEDCIYNCKIKEFVDRTGSFPISFLNFNENYIDLKFSTFDEYLNFNWSEKCSELCGHNTDCYREYFISDFKEHHFSFEVDRFQLAIDFPTHPTTIYEISLKMSFEEYLCLIASILSLWFGFSIIVFTEFCRMIFNRIIVQFNIQNRNLFSINSPIYQANNLFVIATGSKNNQRRDILLRN